MNKPPNISRPIKLSYSSYHSYKHCPASYGYSLQGRKRKVNQRDSFAGSVTHEVFQRWLATGTYDTKLLWGYFDEMYDGMLSKAYIKWRAIESSAKSLEQQLLKGETRTLLQSLIATLSRERILLNKAVSEWPFSIDLGGVLRVRGRVDLFYNQNGSLRLLDFKTSHNLKYLDEDQLRIYDFAISQHAGKKVEYCGYLLMRQGMIVWRQYSWNDTKAVIANMIKAAKQIEQGAFVHKPSSEACRYCGYAWFCAYAFGGKHGRKKPI